MDPTANLSTSWINNPDLSTWLIDGTKVTTLLSHGTASGPRFACGFYCKLNCDSYIFAIFFTPENYIGIPEVVWSANPRNPVRANAGLQLTDEGDLVLREANGALAWSTNTAGKAVSGLTLTEMGNLLLFGANRSVIWQSFDHPTDCLLPGQILASGKNLTANTSSFGNNSNSFFTLSMTNSGLVASVLTTLH